MTTGVYNAVGSVATGTELARLTGNGTLTVVTGADGTQPTLTSIADDKSGGPVPINTQVNHTVTFSEDMDGSTVSAADFGNALPTPPRAIPSNVTADSGKLFGCLYSTDNRSRPHPLHNRTSEIVLCRS